MADFPYTYKRIQWEEPGYTVAQHTGSGPVVWSLVNKVVIHYTAASNLPDGDPGELPWFESVRNYIRRIQKDYAINRGYSIGYNICVDQAGNSWQLRGQDYACAANAGVNSSSFAILVMVDGNDPAGNAAVNTIRNIVAWARGNTNNTVTVVGHKDVGATACPGAGLYDQIQAGFFEPTMSGGYDDMTPVEPQRVYDTRTGPGMFKAGEVRQIPVVFGSKAFIHVTAGGGSQAGWVAVSSDGSFSGGTSLVNFMPGTYAHDGAPVNAPGGKVYVQATAPCHVIIDLMAKG